MNGEGNVQVGLAVNSSSLLFAIIVLSAFLGLAIIVSLMRIYKKAGKPAISAIIPIWNLISWLQIIEKPMWYIVLYMVPFVNIVIMFQMYILLAKKFGKGAGFGVGMVFLPMIFIPLLSFSNFEGNVNEKEETVYNPFNEVQVEQVMPSTPINDVNVPVQPESVAIPNVEQSDNMSVPVMDAPVQPIVETIEVSSVPTNGDVQENQELSVNNIGSVADASIIKLPEEQTLNPVIENNMGVNVQVADNSNNISNIPEVSVTDGILPEQQTVVSFEDNGVGIQDNNNKGVQDITNSINVSNEIQAKDIAFGSVPVVENPATEVIHPTIETMESVVSTVEESVINNNVVEPLQNNEQVEEVIEMPEIATKTCPACGVSLAEDTKFCVSCGTQL